MAYKTLFLSLLAGNAPSLDIRALLSALGVTHVWKVCGRPKSDDINAILAIVGRMIRSSPPLVALLKRCTEEHFHEMERKCSRKDCHNRTVDGYHIYLSDHCETLDVNLMMAAMINCAVALSKGLPQREVVQLTLYGLVHGVGKPAAMCFVDGESGVELTYPGHEAIGATRLRPMWTEVIGEWFTQEEWGTMCDAVRDQSCGPPTVSSEVRKYLVVGRVGRTFARCYWPGVDVKKFVADQAAFEDACAKADAEEAAKVEEGAFTVRVVMTV